MSHPARDPMRSIGIDGQANTSSRRRDTCVLLPNRPEAAV